MPNDENASGKLNYRPMNTSLSRNLDLLRAIVVAVVFAGHGMQSTFATPGSPPTTLQLLVASGARLNGGMLRLGIVL